MKRFLRSVSVAVLLCVVSSSAWATCGYSGSTYVRAYDWTDDAAAAVPITASRMDEEDDCVAAALSSVVKRNGDSAMTGNLPMGTNRITGLADGTAATDAANLNQVQINIEGAVAAGGTVDAITATYSPAVTALEDKMILRVVAAGANTSATPSFTPNGLTTRTIVKHGGQALIAGDIAGSEHVLLLQYDLGNTRWELLNPAWGSDTTAFATTFLDDAAASNVRTTLDAQEDIMTSRGDLVTRNASATARVAIGSANRFLQSDGTDFAWGQVNLGESDVTGTLPIGNVAVFNGLTTDDVLDNDSDFVPYYDAGEAANNKTTLRRLSDGGFLETATASSSSAIGFALDSYPECANFRVNFINVLPATAGAEMNMRTATDGSGTGESGASDYGWNNLTLVNATGASSFDVSDSEIQIAEDMDEGATSGMYGELMIYRPAASNQSVSKWSIRYIGDTAGGFVILEGGGKRLAAADVTDIQFLMSTGNIASGTFDLYCERN